MREECRVRQAGVGEDRRDGWEIGRVGGWGSKHWRVKTVLVASTEWTLSKGCISVLSRKIV